ncbi:MAG TPA: CinA family nicotinamide mononucleotide deamidase-related protein [Chloroflexota bacterium]|nr:CinA family nicotinamide mononucleotide deamidase-related protein [Chloroflexota bacterium]
MKAEIVSVGTEILLGMIVDTNAQYLCQQLAEIGVDVFWISQVGDNLDRVVDVFRRGLGRSDAIIATGGLGPTEDDLTHESVAAAVGERITIDPDLERELRENFARRGRPMPERNVKQAALIPSATPLPNPIGTAPGWWVEWNGKVIATMPGVPAEMRRMWQEQVRPRLRQRSGAGVLVTTTLKVLGLGESAVEEQLGDAIHSTNPTVATYAKPDGVQVRVSAKAPDEDAARNLLRPMVAQLEAVLGGSVYGRDNDTLASGAAKLLAAHGWTIASAEIGTGGSLTSDMSNDPGLVDRYAGGFVLGSSGDLLGADSSEPSDLARAARARTGADVGIAAVVIEQGPDGRPVGRCAVDVRGSSEADSTRMNMAPPELRRRVAVEALGLLIRALRKG